MNFVTLHNRLLVLLSVIRIFLVQVVYIELIFGAVTYKFNYENSKQRKVTMGTVFFLKMIPVYSLEAHKETNCYT